MQPQDPFQPFQNSVEPQSAPSKPPRQRKTNGQKVRVAVLVTILLLVASPVIAGLTLFIGLRVYCADRTGDMDTLAAEVRESIDTSGLKVGDVSVANGGDCTTGTGVVYTFDVNQQYISPTAMQQDVFSKLSDAGMVLPEFTAEPSRISAVYRSNDSTMTNYYNGINRVDLQHEFLGKRSGFSDRIVFEFKLNEAIPCTGRGEEMICSGVTRDAFQRNFYTSQAVDTAAVRGTVHLAD